MYLRSTPIEFNFCEGMLACKNAMDTFIIILLNLELGFFLTDHLLCLIKVSFDNLGTYKELNL